LDTIIVVSVKANTRLNTDIGILVKFIDSDSILRYQYTPTPQYLKNDVHPTPGRVRAYS
jgi:predicted SPOUT superfamily RNA methylase MTH1